NRARRGGRGEPRAGRSSADRAGGRRYVSPWVRIVIDGPLERHALFRELLQRLIALLEIEAHGTQDLRRFGELNIAVFHDLHPVTPGIEKIEEPPWQNLRAGGLGELPHGRTVVDDEAEVPLLVARRRRALHQGDELIAYVDEGAVLAAAAQLEGEDAAIKGKRLVDATHLEGDMIDAHEVGFS